MAVSLSININETYESTNWDFDVNNSNIITSFIATSYNNSDVSVNTGSTSDGGDGAGDKSSNSELIDLFLDNIIIVISSGVGLIGICLLIFCICRYRKKRVEEISLKLKSGSVGDSGQVTHVLNRIGSEFAISKTNKKNRIKRFNHHFRMNKSYFHHSNYNKNHAYAQTHNTNNNTYNSNNNNNNNNNHDHSSNGNVNTKTSVVHRDTILPDLPPEVTNNVSSIKIRGDKANDNEHENNNENNNNDGNNDDKNNNNNDNNDYGASIAMTLAIRQVKDENDSRKQLIVVDNENGHVTPGGSVEGTPTPNHIHDVHATQTSLDEIDINVIGVNSGNEGSERNSDNDNDNDIDELFGHATPGGDYDDNDYGGDGDRQNETIQRIRTTDVDDHGERDHDHEESKNKNNNKHKNKKNSNNNNNNNNNNSHGFGGFKKLFHARGGNAGFYMDNNENNGNNGKSGLAAMEVVNNASPLPDDASVEEIERWKHEEVLEWIETNLTNNGYDNDKVSQFIKECAKKALNGSMLIEFRNDEELLDQFENSFSLKNRNGEIWTLVRSAILSLGKDESML